MHNNVESCNTIAVTMIDLLHKCMLVQIYTLVYMFHYKCKTLLFFHVQRNVLLVVILRMAFLLVLYVRKELIRREKEQISATSVTLNGPLRPQDLHQQMTVVGYYNL